MYPFAHFVLAAGLVAFTVVVRCSACADMVNLALDKPASQSSTYRTSIGFLAVAGSAVDGNTATDFNRCQTCTHTNHDADPWWMVDLQKDFLIGRIEITSRDNNVLRHTRILVGRGYSKKTGLRDSWLCAEFVSQPAGSTVSYPCTQPALGRFVMVTTRVTSGFVLCEVKVFGPPSGPQTGMCQERFSRTKIHSLPTSTSIVTANVTGVVQCAVLCDTTNKCHAFAVETSKSAVSKCYLYDCVGSAFTPNEMANVYSVMNYF